MINNQGNKTVLYLISNRINGFIGVFNGKGELSNECQCLFLCGPLSFTTSVSLLANEVLIARASALVSCQSYLYLS